MNQCPVITVVLCTYNNAESLAITLQQLSKQKLQYNGLVEIIVVDNNSPDHTKKVFFEFSQNSQLDNRYIFEGRQGLSHARNTGVADARGDYILFTDDDAELSPYWLESYLERIDSNKPDCLYSRINIIWDQQKPWWFIPEYTPCFVGVDYGDQPLVIVDIHREFYGKNFCMKKTTLLELGGFDPALGRNGTKLIAGEETLLYRKMVEQNRQLLYFPEAPVGHRLKKREYLAENIKKQFIDGAYSTHHIAKTLARKKILGRPARAFFDSLISLAKSSLLCPLYLLIGRKPESYFYYLNILKNITFIKLWIWSP
ncbi:MAG: glycosyltransferase family 2 protein [Gammaproteobacteria bacterium]|nr:MAG: glycosyltransferase family 2 protein [Gammaproteobacteria bacterium]